MCLRTCMAPPEHHLTHHAGSCVFIEKFKAESSIDSAPLMVYVSRFECRVRLHPVFLSLGRKALVARSGVLGWNPCVLREIKCFTCVLSLWQQYLDNGCCMIDTAPLLLLSVFIWNLFFFFTMSMKRRILSFLILCIDDELDNGPAITAPAIRHEARRMWVHDKICRRQT